MIDPIITGTYLGGDGADYAWILAVDDEGGAVVAGVSNAPGFPVTVGAYDTTYDGELEDVIVARMSSSGDLRWATYISGRSDDECYGVVVEPDGSVAIAGTTASSDFPLTEGALRSTGEIKVGLDDAFLTRLGPEGDTLLYSTRIGGDNRDMGTVLKVNNGSLLLAGWTTSPDFPVTPGSYTVPTKGNINVFVMRLPLSADTILASTVFGGSSADTPMDLVIDGAGRIYIAGLTQSANFPVSASAFQPTYSGKSYDGYVLALDSSLSMLEASTYIGGDGEDWLYRLALDHSGNVLAVGNTRSTDYPVTSEAINVTHAGAEDAVLVKLDPDLSQLLYGTYVGGPASQSYFGLSVDRRGRIAVAGSSSDREYPISPNAEMPTVIGGSAGVLTLFDPVNMLTIHSTYIGRNMSARSIAFDTASNLHMCGRTLRDGVELTPGAPDTTFVGSSEGFYAKYRFPAASMVELTAPNGKSMLFSSKLYPNPASTQAQVQVSITQASTMRIGLYDEAGKAVRPVSSFWLTPGSTSIEMDLKGVPSGSYRIVLTNDDGTISHPLFVVQ